jgi:hypothetical protein
MWLGVSALSEFSVGSIEPVLEQHPRDFFPELFWNFNKVRIFVEDPAAHQDEHSALGRDEDFCKIGVDNFVRGRVYGDRKGAAVSENEICGIDEILSIIRRAHKLDVPFHDVSPVYGTC